MTEEKKELMPIPTGEIMPLAAAKIAAMMNAFDEAKRLVARPGDFIRIQGREVGKKSLWRRLARAFALSVEIVRLDIRRDEAGNVLSADCVARATHPAGASMEAYGGADINEKRGWNKPADMIATAQTRAVSRAISDLIAGGEVTADEMDESDDGPRPTRNPKSTVPEPRITDDQKTEIMARIKLHNLNLAKTQKFIKEWFGKDLDFITENEAVNVIEWMNKKYPDITPIEEPEVTTEEAES